MLQWRRNIFKDKLVHANSRDLHSVHVAPAETMLWFQSIDGIDHKIQEAVE